MRLGSRNGLCRSLQVGLCAALAVLPLAGGLLSAQQNGATPGQNIPQETQPQVDQFCQVLNRIGREGAGNEAAISVLNQVPTMSAADGLTLIRSMQDDNRLAANWLRLSAQSVFDRSPPNASDLRQIINDPQAGDLSREAAFAFLSEFQTEAAQALVPAFEGDSCLPLRRFAIARLLESAASESAAGNTQGSLQAAGQALDAARDIDQVTAAIKAINALIEDESQQVDSRQFLGLITRWQVVGPFDNSGGGGFAQVFAPEQSLATPDFQAKFSGKTGQVQWQTIQSDDREGFVDINKLVGKDNGACVYLAAPLESDAARSAEVRVGTYNAIKVWVNGQPCFDYETYHTNEMLDQYTGAAELKKGTNWIVVKLCQNEQKQSWAQNWRFVLRVSDASGKAIAAADPSPGSGD